VTAGLEIERKFLLERLPESVIGMPGVAIEQGYVAIDGDVEVRVRRLGERRVLTVKGGDGLVRAEEELEIDERRFTSLWGLTAGRRLEKTRRAAALGDGLLLEVDEYHGALAGLIVAEVEFPSVGASEAFAAPRWLGSDVTDDPRYANRRLATDGVPGRR
jgi:CYTH domain-containing protein